MSDKDANTALKTPFNFNETWEELLDNNEFVKIFLSDILMKHGRSYWIIVNL
jgi:maltose alpha-D-glucosyltransferase/alpha-amylase